MPPTPSGTVYRPGIEALSALNQTLRGADHAGAVVPASGSSFRAQNALKFAGLPSKEVLNNLLVKAFKGHCDLAIGGGWRGTTGTVVTRFANLIQGIENPQYVARAMREVSVASPETLEALLKTTIECFATLSPFSRRCSADMGSFEWGDRRAAAEPKEEHLGDTLARIAGLSDTRESLRLLRSVVQTQIRTLSHPALASFKDASLRLTDRVFDRGEAQVEKGTFDDRAFFAMARNELGNGPLGDLELSLRFALLAKRGILGDSGSGAPERPRLTCEVPLSFNTDFALDLDPSKLSIVVADPNGNVDRVVTELVLYNLLAKAGFFTLPGAVLPGEGALLTSGIIEDHGLSDSGRFGAQISAVLRVASMAKPNDFVAVYLPDGSKRRDAVAAASVLIEELAAHGATGLLISGSRQVASELGVRHQIDVLIPTTAPAPMKLDDDWKRFQVRLSPSGDTASDPDREIDSNLKTSLHFVRELRKLVQTLYPKFLFRLSEPVDLFLRPHTTRAAFGFGDFVTQHSTMKEHQSATNWTEGTLLQAFFADLAALGDQRLSAAQSYLAEDFGGKRYVRDTKKVEAFSSGFPDIAGLFVQLFERSKVSTIARDAARGLKSGDLHHEYIDLVLGVARAIHLFGYRYATFNREKKITASALYPCSLFAFEGRDRQDAQSFANALKRERERLVPFCIDYSGMNLIVGPNSSGKTALTKTLALAAGLARCNLPMPDEISLPRFDALCAFTGAGGERGDFVTPFFESLRSVLRRDRKKLEPPLVFCDEFPGVVPDELPQSLASILRECNERGAVGIFNSHVFSNTDEVPPEVSLWHSLYEERVDGTIVPHYAFAPGFSATHPTIEALTWLRETQPALYHRMISRRGE